MLFTSAEFIFGFLPLALGIYCLLARSRYSLALRWLVVASLFFYGWWNPGYLLLIGGSILFNYTIGRFILKSQSREDQMPGSGAATAKTLLTLGIAGNLAAIAWFKYAGFIAQNVNGLFGADMSVPQIVLPLAISFFTFQQIAYLVDTYQGKVKDIQFGRYCLFVLFFPQLIAGPIVHHGEVMPQFHRPQPGAGLADNISRGATLFAIGLFKKMVLADTLAGIANPAFLMAGQGQAMTLLDAWAGALAYTFQLYFDFSGYSDMALGLAIMFGISLPLNFYSPYKARSIIEFWRRWHMTLSRFLRDYVYIPLGGNRHGKLRRFGNLLITMLLGGLWHGAGWTFVIWGGLHGLFLIINHGWRALLDRLGNNALRATSGWAAAPLTFFCVVIAWVYFRSPTLDGAHHMLASMFDMTLPGGQHMGLSNALLSQVSEFPLFLLLEPMVDQPKSVAVYAMLLFSAVIALLMPNVVELMGDKHPALRETIPAPEAKRTSWGWSPNLPWALATALLLFLCMTSATVLSPFVYFQF